MQKAQLSIAKPGQNYCLPSALADGHDVKTDIKKTFRIAPEGFFMVLKQVFSLQFQPDPKYLCQPGSVRNIRKR